MTLFKKYLLACVLVSASFSSLAEEYVRPLERTAQQYKQKLWDRKFAELESDVKRARDGNLSLSDGQSLHTAIIGGITGCVTTGCDDEARDWQIRYDRLSEWREKFPRSATVELAQAIYYFEYAYAVRGSGYANTVKNEAWPTFHENMEKAHQLLEKASPAAKQDPQWYVTMMHIAVAQAWDIDKFNKIYLQAQKQFPYYLSVYFVGANYFAPRWHGSPEDLRKFVENSVTRTQSKLGESMYARLNWALSTDSMFSDGQADWPRMKSGFRRIVKDFPDPWNVNKFAYFACMAGDKATVAELAPGIGDKPILDAWRSSKAFYDWCVASAKK